MDWERLANDHFDAARDVFTRLRPAAEAAASALVAALRGGNTILVCGNGGSAADAPHFAAELVNRFQRERAPWPALSLATDSSVLTSIANDYNYSQVFSKQVQALGRPGDVLVAISTSGNAPNVVAAAQAARALSMPVVVFTGRGGGALAPLADHLLCIDASVTARIQEAHAILVHALCELVEDALA